MYVKCIYNAESVNQNFYLECRGGGVAYDTILGRVIESHNGAGKLRGKGWGLR